MTSLAILFFRIASIAYPAGVIRIFVSCVKCLYYFPPTSLFGEGESWSVLHFFTKICLLFRAFINLYYILFIHAENMFIYAELCWFMRKVFRFTEEEADVRCPKFQRYILTILRFTKKETEVRRIPRIWRRNFSRCTACVLICKHFLCLNKDHPIWTFPLCWKSEQNYVLKMFACRFRSVPVQNCMEF